MLIKQVFKDAIEIDVNKKATIMRDGYYIYLACEVGLPDSYGKEQVRVYRPASEVKKAYDRFKQIERLPLVFTHPQNFLDLSNPKTYEDGEAFNPSLSKIVQTTILNSELKLRDEVYEEYKKGIKELSCGWAGYFEKVENKDYDFIQRFEDINHIALVEHGRAGDICRILDYKPLELINGGKKMPNVEKILSILKELGVEADKAKVEEAIKKHAEAPEAKDEGTESKEEEKKEGEQKTEGSESKEDEEQSLHLEMTKQGLKSFLVSHAGKSEEESEAIVSKYFESKQSDVKNYDDKQEKVMDEDSVRKIVDEAVKAESMKFSDVLPVFKSGEISIDEAKGKSAKEIKKLFVQKTMKLTKISDAAIDEVFELALKNYQHPNWSKINDHQGENTLANEINNISFNKKEEKLK